MKVSSEITSDGLLSETILNELKQAIQSLRYGSIEITIHDGCVTQIEKREKVRFREQSADKAKRND